MPKPQTTREQMDAIAEHLDTCRDGLQSLLTWGDLTNEERGAITLACNAAELSACRLRGDTRPIGPTSATCL